MNRNDDCLSNANRGATMSGIGATKQTPGVDSKGYIHLTLNVGDTLPYGIPTGAKFIARDKQNRPLTLDPKTGRFVVANVPEGTDVLTSLPGAGFDISKLIIPAGIAVAIWFLLKKKRS